MGLTPTNWPSARHFTEALQCPALCFANPFLRDTLPAVDKLGMPLVTSGQFAYVYKLNRSDGGSWAVRCFRSYLADRQQRYAALDAHFRETMLAALPRFAYEPEGLLSGGRRYPILVMEWIKAPTLDSYLEKVLDRREVLQHLAAEWVRLMAGLRTMEVAHGDLQHGNILVQNGALRLVDLDGMFVPALRGWRACEVGHQHYQHPRRREDWFHQDLDNFPALSVYLSLIALVERPSLWGEYHDENLLFTKADFQAPDKSALFSCIRELGAEHQRLADILAAACRRETPDVPPLTELAEVQEDANLPAWMNAPAGMEVATRTREAQPPPVYQPGGRPAPAYAMQPGTYVRPSALSNPNVNTPPTSIQTLFGAQKQLDPADVWGNTFHFAGQGAKAVFSKIGAFWIIFLFSSVWIRLITGFWDLFGVDAAMAFVLTFLLITFGFVLYGFVRALDEQNNPGQQAALAGGANAPAVMASAPVAAALPPAQPTNIPWYAQNTQTAPPAQPLPPGARRAPDWVLAARQQSTPPPNTASAPLPGSIVIAHPAKSLFHFNGCVELHNVALAELRQVSSLQVAQQAGYQPCPSCIGAKSWPFGGGTPSAASPFSVPAPPKPAPAAVLSPPAATQAPPPVLGNRDTGLYHWPDCEDAVVMEKDDEMPFVSPRAAELAGYRRCPVCKPSSRSTPNRAALPVVANRETRIYHLLDCPWAVAIQKAHAEKFPSPYEAETKGYFRCTNCRPDAKPDNSAPSGTLIGHKGVKVFHRRGCHVATHIPASQSVGFASTAQAQSDGYQSCAICQP